MRGVNDAETTAGAIEALGDLMPDEMTQAEADEILEVLEQLKHMVECSVVLESDTDTSYAPEGSQSSS